MSKPNFSGYATKNDLRCSDGRVIRKDAFAANDGSTVPLVWQHCHNDPANVLGHARLENRQDGVYAYCYLNDSDAGKMAKELVEHGDVNAMSIYANRLRQNGSDVQHGNIVEVSLVLSPANPGALIENVAIQHGETYDVSDEEAVIYTGETLTHSEQAEDMTKETLEHADEPQTEDTASDDGKTVGDIYEAMTDEQKTVVAFLIQQALSDQDDSDEGSDTAEHSDQETDMHNIFEGESSTLEHADLTEFASAVFDDAKSMGSFRDSFLAHAQEYGIENINMLFPDAKALSDEPTFIKRQTEWVQTFMSSTTHRPFSRIKSLQADITGQEARARGYVTGAKKVSEVIRLLKRVTTPTTVYKKQVLDRDDVLDVADFNVVAWLHREMRIMLDEEIARAALVGDGRPEDHRDKINEENIRPIWTDDELYAPKVEIAADASEVEIIDTIFAAMEDYRGSGRPTLFLTPALYYKLLLKRDSHERRLYESEAALAAALGVAAIVKVEIMKDLTRTVGEEGEEETFALKAIAVNPVDYVFGSDKGGEITSFEDFDIDYNQHKYLLEGRCSGALRDPKTALVFETPVE